MGKTGSVCVCGGGRGGGVSDGIFKNFDKSKLVDQNFKTLCPSRV